MDPTAKLNNLESNLRYVCTAEQFRNKIKRGKGLYSGVCYCEKTNRWTGFLGANGELHMTPSNICEHACARALNDLRARVLGADAILHKVETDCSNCPHCTVTKYGGVSKRNDKWRGFCTANGIPHHLSPHPCQHEMARRVNALRLELLGQSAVLNVVKTDCANCVNCSKEGASEPSKVWIGKQMFVPKGLKNTVNSATLESP
jgi:hypothetical protein